MAAGPINPHRFLINRLRIRSDVKPGKHDAGGVGA
jgi:hypothetical protein